MALGFRVQIALALGFRIRGREFGVMKLCIAAMVYSMHGVL